MDLVSLETIQNIAQIYGYWAVGIGILLENAGLPIPGETITLVGGFLAGSGELNYWFVLGSATAGAIVGDNIGYWLGFYGGWSFLLRLSQIFRFPEETLNNVRERFRRNMAQAVVVGRFVAVLRIFAGPMAGIVRMPYLSFLVCNALGAILWASVMTSIAFFCGRFVSLETLIMIISQFTLVLLGTIAVWVGFTFWYERRPQQID